MVVYVDVLLCVNIFINFFLLLCVKRFLKITVSARRLIFSSAAAGLFSLVVFLPEMPFAISLIFRIISGCAVVFIAFGRTNHKQFIKRVCAFVLTSAAFGGLSALFYGLFKPSSMLIFNDVVYFDISPVTLIIITLICYFILRLIQKITGREETKNNFCTVKITAGGKSFTCLGKVDTGCTLKEPFSGAPVIVAEKRILGGFIPDQRSTRVIPFESMGGAGMITGFLPDAVRLNDKPISQKVYIGISDRNFNGEFQALINAEVLE